MAQISTNKSIVDSCSLVPFVASLSSLCLCGSNSAAFPVAWEISVSSNGRLSRTPSDDHKHLTKIFPCREIASSAAADLMGRSRQPIQKN
jgi:hypothetical protein